MGRDAKGMEPFVVPQGDISKKLLQYSKIIEFKIPKCYNYS